ncbi:sodium-coupled monocarboxylate transporter 2-like [Rhipicephalus microplus]|uniref:sodium-coupled monocarboxylate transporter 2-like n=1 Tax=Rhipicephalus microplus TaxID=6941 RepID=UPI003F6BD55E
MLVKVFNAPLLWCNIAIGLSGTIYTALGGLRGVVWTDCTQFIIIMVAPTAVFAKIMVDAFSPNSTIQPLSDMDVGMYIGNFKFDLTSDENVWSCLVGASGMGMYRLCLDQMVVQRIMASPTVKKAQRTVSFGALLLLLPYLTCTLLGIAITIWYRGCDPGLSGAIKSIDQIIPHYITTELVNIPGFVGLYLAGVVSAGTSTISSAINSQAAILYVDVISPAYKRADEHVLLITRCTAVILGVTMTAFSSLVVKMGSLTRILLMVNTAVTAPFVGLCILAVLFPFVHCKGAGVSTLLMVVYQLWHMAGVITSGIRSPRLPVSTDYCPGNHSMFLFQNVTSAAPNTQTQEPFFMFRLSFFWSSFFAFIGTIVLAVIISAVTGETNCRKDETLCNYALVRLWQKMRSLASDKKHHVAKGSCEAKYIVEVEKATLMGCDYTTRKDKYWAPDDQDATTLAVA